MGDQYVEAVNLNKSGGLSDERWDISAKTPSIFS